MNSPPVPDLSRPEPLSTGTPHPSSGILLLNSLPHNHTFPPIYLPPSQPNTDPRGNAPSPTLPLPLVNTVLNEHAWSFYLHEYPNHNVVDTLIHIICHGCNLGYKEDHDHSQTCSNLKSAAEHSDAISADIIAQVANGRTQGPFLSPPLPHF